jgi:drug/metabolite transporter (DMT)-like permease
MSDTTQRLRVFALTTIAMGAFAANSVLCRRALATTTIDAATFTSVRLASGALMLALIMLLRRNPLRQHGNWFSAAALFAYAAGFSFAYLALSTGTGALLLFTAVQTTMIGHALWRGERLRASQWFGLLLSITGLVVLLLPGITAPPLFYAALMLLAGGAWGVYSIRGRGCADAAGETAANFVRAVPLTLALSAVFYSHMHFDAAGAVYAVLSGALASGLGYTIWYSALRGLSGTSAAAVQLSVPVLAALGGIVWLGEAPTLRLAFASAAILGGIALVVLVRARPR